MPGVPDERDSSAEYGYGYTLDITEEIPMEAEIRAVLRPLLEECFDRLIIQFDLSLEDPDASAPLVGMLGTLVAKASLGLGFNSNGELNDTTTP